MTKLLGTNFILAQWLTGIGVTLLLIQMGILGGCISPLLAKLTAPDSPIFLSPEEASWVASLVNIGRFLGAALGSISASYLGSKKSIVVTLIPVALGWLGLALAKNVAVLYVARMFSGIGVGMTFSTFPLYLGEVSVPEIRGALVSLAFCGTPIGQIIGSIASSYLDLVASSSIYLGLCLFLMLVFLCLPESPHHLMKKGNDEATRKSIDWYRAGRGVEEEFIAVGKFVESENSIKFMDRLREFRKPGIRNALFQVLTLFTFMQICGLNSILFYMEIIFVKAKCTIIKPADIVIYINICGVFATAGSIFLIDRCGRRFLMLVSSIGTVISMIGMMSHFLLIDMNIDVTNLQWLPITSMLLYMLSFFVGLLPVPSTVLSEMFPANIKCIAACFASFTAGLTSFLSSKTYQPMVDIMGETYVFLIYAIIGLSIIPYTLFIMPETKGKSLQQIQDELIRKK